MTAASDLPLSSIEPAEPKPEFNWDQPRSAAGQISASREIKLKKSWQRTGSKIIFLVVLTLIAAMVCCCALGSMISPAQHPMDRVVAFVIWAVSGLFLLSFVKSLIFREPNHIDELSLGSTLTTRIGSARSGHDWTDVACIYFYDPVKESQLLEPNSNSHLEFWLTNGNRYTLLCTEQEQQKLVTWLSESNGEGFLQKTHGQFLSIQLCRPHLRPLATHKTKITAITALINLVVLFFCFAVLNSYVLFGVVAAISVIGLTLDRRAVYERLNVIDKIYLFPIDSTEEIVIDWSEVSQLSREPIENNFRGNLIPHILISRNDNSRVAIPMNNFSRRDDLYDQLCDLCPNLDVEFE